MSRIFVSIVILFVAAKSHAVITDASACRSLFTDDTGRLPTLTITGRGPQSQKLVHFVAEIIRIEQENGFNFFPNKFEILVVPKVRDDLAQEFGVHKLRTFADLIIVPQKYVDHFLNDDSPQYDPSGAFRAIILQELGVLLVERSTLPYHSRSREIHAKLAQQLRIGWDIVERISRGETNDLEDMQSTYNNLSNPNIELHEEQKGIHGDIRPLLIHLFVAAVAGNPQELVSAHTAAFGIVAPEYGFTAYSPPAHYTTEWRNGSSYYFFSEARPRIWKYFSNQPAHIRADRVNRMFYGLNGFVTNFQNSLQSGEFDYGVTAESIHRANQELINFIERLMADDII